MFIPLGDDNSGRTVTPFVVYGLIGLNILMWLLQMMAGDDFTVGYSTIPYEITHGVDLTGTKVIVADGKSIPLPHAPGPTPIYLTLLSSMFMHASWMHIIGNMVYLWIFGDQIENLLGHVRFVIFYLACGLVASFAHIIVGPDSVIPSLGASGAIAGVLGAYLVKYPKNSVRVLAFNTVVPMPALIVLGLWGVLQVVSQISIYGAGEATGVAYMAHIGGFIAGIVLVFLMTPRGKHLPATA